MVFEGVLTRGTSICALLLSFRRDSRERERKESRSMQLLLKRRPVCPFCVSQQLEAEHALALCLGRPAGQQPFFCRAQNALIL